MITPPNSAPSAEMGVSAARLAGKIIENGGMRPVLSGESWWNAAGTVASEEPSNDGVDTLRSTMMHSARKRGHSRKGLLG